MPTVHYAHQFGYSYDETGNLFPRLAFKVSRPDRPGQPVAIDAYLDSGAERTLFSGWIGRSLGIDVLSGARIGFESTTGHGLTATIHRVRISNPELGDFDLDVGFSSVEIRRNLLGRDFFDLVQIGFREHHLEFYVKPEP